jgi:hypothetical protein
MKVYEDANTSVAFNFSVNADFTRRVKPDSRDSGGGNQLCQRRFAVSHKKSGHSVVQERPLCIRREESAFAYRQ